MKKIIAFVLAMTMCVAMCISASAAFAPSVTYKPAPELVVNTNDNGEQILGTVKNEADEVVIEVAADSLVVTPVSEAEKSEQIPAEAAQTLKECFEKLDVAELNLGELCADLEKIVANFQAVVSGTETLAHEDVAQAGGLSLETFEATDKDYSMITVANLVVKDLFDVSILDEALTGYLEEDANSIELTFDVGVKADDFVAVMVYKNDAWSAVKNVVNNGDGSITCTFAHFCPVAILTAPAAQEAPVETEPVETEPVETEPVESEPAQTEPVITPDEEVPADYTLWYVIVAVAVVAVIVVIVVAGKKTKKNEEVKSN